MKIAILAATFILFLLTHSSYSQAIDSLTTQYEIKAEVLVNKLDHELNLTAQQQEPVYDILLKRSEDWQNRASSLKIEEKKALIDSLNAEALTGLKNVFTDEQLKIFIELREDLAKQKELYQHHNKVTDEDLEMEF